MSASEKRAVGGANGSVLRIRTRCPGRSGLGKAYRSVMSAVGSATARGPEMWCDTERRRDALGVRGFLQQGRERRMRQGVLGRGVVEHALERIVDALRLADLLDGAAVVACIAAGGLLGAEDELLDRVEIGQARVALDMAEDPVEQFQRLGRGILHVAIPPSRERG